MRFYTVFFMFWACFSFGSTQVQDTVPIFSINDSLIISINDAQQKIVKHTITPNQTLYKISRFYGVSIAQILALNPNKTETSLSIGDELIIPLPNRAIKRFRKKNFKSNDFVPLYYQVKQGDTMYGIAKRAFHMPVDTLKERNDLKGGISPGQLLHVGWVNRQGVSSAKGKAQKSTNPLSGKVYREKKTFLAQSKGKKIRKQRGAAYWRKTKTSGSKIYALHDYARIGSVVEVRNPMSGVTLYAKVIGRINHRVTPYGVKVVLSPAAARYLGAINKKFYTEIQYYR